MPAARTGSGKRQIGTKELRDGLREGRQPDVLHSFSLLDESFEVTFEYLRFLGLELRMSLARVDIIQLTLMFDDKLSFLSPEGKLIENLGSLLKSQENGLTSIDLAFLSFTDG